MKEVNMKEFKVDVGSKSIIMETGKLARQAGGSITLTCGGTVVLVTAVISKYANERLGFFPLLVEYKEKTYAAGKFPGGFFKREGRPTEKETLTSRLIDRGIRPLFTDNIINDVQVIAHVLSSDGENNPDMLAAFGASVALSISDVPFNGPLATLRVIKDKEGKLVVNPTYVETEDASLDIILSATKDGIVLIETGANQVPDDDVFQAIKFGYESLTVLLDIQNLFLILRLS